MKLDKKTDPIFEVSSGVQNNALRGLALVQKYNREISPEILGIARQIAKGSVSLGMLKKAYHSLSTLTVPGDKIDADADGGVKEEIVKGLLLGGTSGLATYRKVLKAEGILKSYTKDIPESLTKTEDPNELSSAPILKSTNKELKQATYVVLKPDTVDEHGDIYDAQEVQKACYNFNQSSAKANLCHLIETDGFHVAESYIAPADLILGETLVTKGTWLATLQFTNDALWEAVKNDEFSGVSIGAMALCEPQE